MNRLGKKKLLIIVGIIVAILVIPLTVFVARQQQETRQRAAQGNNIKVYLALADNTTPLTTITAAPNETKTLRVYLDPQGNPISAFSLVGTPSNPSIYSLSNLTEGDGAQKFNAELVKEIDNSGAIHFGKATTTADAAVISASPLLLGTITATATTVGTGNITLSGEVTGPNSERLFTVDFTNLAYTVANPPPVPAAPQITSIITD